MAKRKKLLPDFDGLSLQDPKFQDELLEKAREILDEEGPPVYEQSCLYCSGRAQTLIPSLNEITERISITKMHCYDCGAVYSIQ